MMNMTPKTQTPQANGTEAKPAATPTATPAGMVLGSDAYRGALEPGTAREAWDVAEMMASIGYCGVTSAPEALGRIMTGRGLGLSAMQSLRGVYTVHGRPGIDAALMHALCLQSPLCERFSFLPEESDDTKATFIAKRRGDDPVKHTFTIEDAERMGVVDRGKDDKAKTDNNWNKVRKAMLRARAKSELARIVFPDLIFGMYSREEIEAGFGDAARDPNEMVGDILSDEEAAAERARGAATSVIQAAKRDYAAEAEALKVRISAATTRTDRAEVRAAFEAWDGIEPFRTQVSDLYNATRKVAPAGAAPAPSDPAAPAIATAGPGLVPEGNLFSKTEEGK